MIPTRQILSIIFIMSKKRLIGTETKTKVSVTLLMILITSSWMIFITLVTKNMLSV